MGSPHYTRRYDCSPHDARKEIVAIIVKPFPSLGWVGVGPCGCRTRTGSRVFIGISLQESDGTFRLLCFQVWGDDESERDKSLRLFMLRHCELLTAVGENPHCTHLPPGTGYISETA